MSDIELSTHAQEMLKERNILEEWLWRTIISPDRIEVGADNHMHYNKAISEHGGRILRVVVNPHITPERIITLFFDRRLRR